MFTKIHIRCYVFVIHGENDNGMDVAVLMMFFFGNNLLRLIRKGWIRNFQLLKNKDWVKKNRQRDIFLCFGRIS